MNVGDGTCKVQCVARRVRVNYVHVMRTVCACCGGVLDNQVSIALGFPYCALVHKRCFFMFDFENNWPHPSPMCEYIARALSYSTPNPMAGPSQSSEGTHSPPTLNTSLGGYNESP